MNREDIIRMARMVRDGGHWNQLDLINFAVLVAAHEREACAKVADEQAKDEPYGHAKFRCGNIAAAIRART